MPDPTVTNSLMDLLFFPFGYLGDGREVTSLPRSLHELSQSFAT